MKLIVGPHPAAPSASGWIGFSLQTSKAFQAGLSFSLEFPFNWQFLGVRRVPEKARLLGGLPMFFRSKRFSMIFSVLAISMFAGLYSVAAQSANWVNWNAPQGYDHTGIGAKSVYQYTDSISGAVTDTNGNVVGVTLHGEITDRSCFKTAIGDCDGYWKLEGGWGVFPEGTFTGAVVSELPPTQQMVAQVGDGVRVQNMNFDRTVSGLVMNVYSLGITYKSEYTFDRDFVILTQDPRCDPTALLQYCLVKDGRTLRGFEGNGTIQFEGSMQSLSWEITAPEDFSGFNFALTGVAVPPPPPPPPSSCDLGGARTLNQGQWSSNASFNPLDNQWFAGKFPSGLVIGAGQRSATFNNGNAAKNFMPQGGISMILLSQWTNPNKKSMKNSIAGELVAAKLNVALSPGIAGASVVKGRRLPFEDMTVTQIIQAADTAISWNGSGEMPGADRLKQLDTALRLINHSFMGGRGNKTLACPASSGTH